MTKMKELDGPIVLWHQLKNIICHYRHKDPSDLFENLWRRKSSHYEYFLGHKLFSAPEMKKQVSKAEKLRLLSCGTDKTEV